MNQESKNNLKWAGKIIACAAIVAATLPILFPPKSGGSWAFGLSANEQRQVKDLVVVFPDAIRSIMNNGHKEEFWQETIHVWKARHKDNPDILGSIILPFLEEDNHG